MTLITKPYTVAFLGHRYLDAPEQVEVELEELIFQLLKEKPYVEFLVGRSGEFDQLVSSTIRRCKRSYRDDNASLVLVLPYLTAEYLNNSESFETYYDEIEICPASANAHRKSAYQIRNRFMGRRADLVVFCIGHPYGGAYQTMQYAKEQGATTVLISAED